MKAEGCGFLLVCALVVGAGAQVNDKQSAGYSRKNTFAVFVEGSNTSSHILLGDARQRVLADFGGAYQRRLFRAKGTALSYMVEVRPAVFESDPIQIGTTTTTITSGVNAGTTTNYTYSATTGGKCQQYVLSGTSPAQPGFPGFNYVEDYTCGRRWTFAQEFSPVGLRYAWRTQHKLQPFAEGNGGYMYSNRPIPDEDAGSFNFTFTFGAGVELFRTKSRSVAVEARYHHFSNHATAPANPGTDNVMYKVSYSFGR